MTRGFSSQAFLSFGLLISTLSPARAGLSGCDDLGAIEALPNVDFATEIQPIFDNHCTQCHGGPNPIAFMDLEQGYTQLVDVPSFQIPQFTRITPGYPGDSYLFLKINCANQFEGDRMPREAPPLSLFDQALIRDWINQILIFRTGFE
ncbi:hypothetical protein [Marinicella meishanensis]|uniref:hypothetical protein n=1 Tax=Marinicella meishanensis TaxID=2873263 RepID=UPI001CBAB507|nr:hypothetical protein [Marinicella sp. NBU2979]